MPRPKAVEKLDDVQIRNRYRTWPVDLYETNDPAAKKRFHFVHDDTGLEPGVGYYRRAVKGQNINWEVLRKAGFSYQEAHRVFTQMGDGKGEKKKSIAFSTQTENTGGDDVEKPNGHNPASKEDQQNQQGNGDPTGEKNTNIGTEDAADVQPSAAEGDDLKFDDTGGGDGDENDNAGNGDKATGDGSDGGTATGKSKGLLGKAKAAVGLTGGK